MREVRFEGHGTQVVKASRPCFQTGLTDEPLHIVGPVALGAFAHC